MPEISPAPDVPDVQQLLVLSAEREAALAERDRVIAELTARVAELEARVGKNSQNSDGNQSLNDFQNRAQSKLSPAASRDFSPMVRPRLKSDAAAADVGRSALEGALLDLNKAAKTIERFTSMSTGPVDPHFSREDLSVTYDDEDADRGDD